LKPDELWPDGQPAAIVELPAGTDIWALHDSGFWVVVPTNTCKKKDGSAVMGAGLARDAALRYHDLAATYGESLTRLDGLRIELLARSDDGAARSSSSWASKRASPG
jgi:hypothetical protein